jgi:uncharacterized protein YndB with AHSA1/START domain
VARFIAVVDTPAPPERTWKALTDWPSHSRWTPLTRVRVLTPTASGVGARFVGRTGVGPLAFDDPMEVVEWREPAPGVPGACRVVKHGRVVLGEASFEVAERPGGSRVTWVEDVEIAPVRLTRPFAGLVGRVGRLVFTRSLRHMARELA